MPNPIKAGPFLGINNKLPSEKLTAPAAAGQSGGMFVRDAVNVDLTEVGTFQRRSGVVLQASTTQASCLWSAGDYAYFADGTSLKKFDGTAVTTVATLAYKGAKVSFDNTPRGVVWSDGVQLKLFETGASLRTLAVPAPSPVPTLAGSGGGDSISIFFANVLPSGERSALVEARAYGYSADTLTANVAMTQASSAYTVQAYAAVKGALHLIYTLNPGATSATLPFGATGGEVIPMEYEAPLPAGNTVRYYRGRVYSIVGNAVFYSNPYQYGIYNPATNYFQMESDITLFEPTQTGIFLATADATYFLDGEDVTQAPLRPLAPYGAVPGTVVQEPNHLNMWWMTPRGLVQTTDGNTIEMRQDANIAFDKGNAGASLYREENGLTQIVSSMSSYSTTGGASASSFMDAVTVN